MRLKSLRLKNFRNYTDVCLDLSSGKIIITGENGRGKTNILESIRFLSTLKSPRTADIKDFVKFGEEEFFLSCELQKSGTDIELEINYSLGKTKILKLNGLKTTPKSYKSVLNTVLFTVEDLLLMRGVPQNRRDWLDSAISQIYPAHDERLSKYNKVRLQKNNLLKESAINMDLLDVYNEQIALVGANIIFVREKFLSELKKYAIKKYSEISDIEDFDFEYGFLNSSAEDILNALKKELEARKYEEIARKKSIIGPHRDDICFYVDGKDASKFASQGQQRTIVLALKFAEIELIKNKNGHSPVLLLDDVLAELDKSRQNYLIKSISEDTQTIITSVDYGVFEDKFIRNVTLYDVHETQVQQRYFNSYVQ